MPKLSDLSPDQIEQLKQQARQLRDQGHTDHPLLNFFGNMLDGLDLDLGDLADLFDLGEFAVNGLGALAEGGADLLGGLVEGAGGAIGELLGGLLSG